jgi:UDP-glucose:(heptosyl)LPS alpha-1,3-glucosyltransferase
MLQAESQFYRNFEGTVIAISRQVADELQEAYNVSGAIKVVHHGVDSQRFRMANRDLYRFELRKQLGIGEVKTVALYVGDLTKSHVHLKKLSRILPEITFLVVSGSKAYRWNASNVRFIPHSRKIEQYYAAADVFVFPSENDPFGMVVLEAMASGLPVFCSDQAGASELITSGKDGFVFSLDDWLEATATHLRDVDSLQRIGAEAELTAHRHDWDTVVRKVEQVYVDVASREAAITAPQLRNSAYRYQQ